MPAPFLSQFFRRCCLTVAVVEISLWLFINAERFILTLRKILVNLPTLFVYLPANIIDRMGFDDLFISQ